MSRGLTLKGLMTSYFYRNTATFDVLMQMPDSELRQMPQELVNMLYSLSEAGALPDALDSRIRKLFRRKK